MPPLWPRPLPERPTSEPAARTSSGPEEIQQAICGECGGSPSIARGGRDPRLYLRRSVRPASPSRQRPEAEGSGAHCRSCAFQHEPGSMGPGAGAAELSRLKPHHQGALKKESAEQHSPPAREPFFPESPRSQILLPATASHPLANACKTNWAPFLAPNPKRQTLSRTGPEGEVVGSDRCGDVGRERPLGYFFGFHYGENLHTASASASPRAKHSSPKKAVGGAIQGGGRTQKEASLRSWLVTSFRS